MKKLLITLLSIFSLNSWCSISGSIGATSNYIWRGITQTNSNAAIQGSLDYQNQSFTFGTWFSNASNTSEADFYLGYDFKLSDQFSITTAVTYYHYLPNTDINTVEGFIGFTFGNISLNTSYTPDYFNSDSSALYFVLSDSFQLSQKNDLSLNIELGYSLFDDEIKVGMKNYLDYKIGVAKTINDVEVSFNFTDTDLEASKDQRFSITGMYSF